MNLDNGFTVSWVGGLICLSDRGIVECSEDIPSVKEVVVKNNEPTMGQIKKNAEDEGVLMTIRHYVLISFAWDAYYMHKNELDESRFCDFVVELKKNNSWIVIMSELLLGGYEQVLRIGGIRTRGV